MYNHQCQMYKVIHNLSNSYQKNKVRVLIKIY